MRKHVRAANILLGFGVVLLVALPILTSLGSHIIYSEGAGFGLLLFVALPGLAITLLGAALLAASVSLKNKHRFLSRDRGRTMPPYGGGENREQLEGETRGRV